MERIDNHSNVDDLKIRVKYGNFASIFGIVSNLLASIFKIVIGLLFGSVAVLTSGIDSLSDSVSSVVGLVGFRISATPADKEHPYGHQRMEYISGLVVSIAIIVVSVLLFQSSIQKIVNNDVLIFSYWLIYAIIFSIVVKIVQFIVYTSIHKKINSASVKAMGFDALSNIITLIVVLASLIIYKLTDINLDGYASIVVAIFIFVGGIKLIKYSSSLLLGEAPKEEEITQLKEIILDNNEVISVHDIILHSYGPSIRYASAHVELDSKLDNIYTHNLVDSIEERVLKEKNISLVLHIDPLNTEDKYLNKLKRQVEKIVYNISSDFKYHDLHFTDNKKGLHFDLQIPYEYDMSNEELIETISKEIVLLNPSLIITVKIDRE